MNDEEPQSVLVRDAEASELDETGRVALSAYQEYADRLPPDAWTEYSANIVDVRSRLPESDLIVAVQGGRIVGAVTLFPTDRKRASLVWPPDWTGIRLLAVAPESRGQGIGRMLMEECIRRSRQQGAEAVGLHTTPLMSVAAAMYERIGFVRVPEFDFHPRPRWTVKAYKLPLT